MQMYIAQPRSQPVFPSAPFLPAAVQTESTALTEFPGILLRMGRCRVSLADWDSARISLIRRPLTLVPRGS